MPDPEIVKQVEEGARHGLGGMLTAIGTIITGTTGFIVGAYKTFATKKELESVKKEIANNAMTLNDNYNSLRSDVTGKVDTTYLALDKKIDDNQRQLMTVLLDISKKG